MTKEICYRIKGRVQGVGFRRWVARQVDKIGNISGYVMNMENRDVCLYISAAQEKITELEEVLMRGSLFARVDSVEYSPQDTAYFPKINDGTFVILRR